MSEIKVFKLINGEELISQVTSGSESGFFLEKPANIMMQQTERGVGVGMAPYMPYANGKIYLYATAIASEASPDLQLENEYNRLFGSGIQIVSAGAMPQG
jgi:hypothetical protein